MVPNTCTITLFLSQLVYITVAEFIDKDDILEIKTPEQFFLELKKEFNTFGNEFNNFGEKIKSFRKDLEQQLLAELANADHDIKAEMQPLFTAYRDSSMQMIKKISAKGADTEARVNAIVTFLTEVISHEINNSTDIPPTGMTYGTQHVCMSHGRMSGLRSLKHVSTKITTTTDSFDIRITYVFDNLHIHYGVFYLQMWPWSSVRGELDIILGKNEIELVLNLPKFDTLMRKIIQNDCIVRLKDFNVNELEYRSSRLTGEKNKGYDIASSLMDTYLGLNESMLKKRIETRVLEEVRRTLRATGNLVCNDKTFAQLILRKGGTLDEEADEEAFSRYCGSDV